jgi:hypothetical protein
LLDLATTFGADLQVLAAADRVNAVLRPDSSVRPRSLRERAVQTTAEVEERAA